jgi:pyridoxine/pyridoxamine 5'-phosphate oxidase
MTPPWLKAFRTAIETVNVPIILSLATVDRSGDPRVRSVVCRRVDEYGGLWITSDSRSAKNTELVAHPRAAASCLLLDLGLQFQFSGDAKIDQDFDRRHAVWASMKSKTKAAFMGPEPGAAKAHADHFVDHCDDEYPPESFSLIILRPSQVELLDVRPSPHLRWRWVFQSRWQIFELNP